MRTRLQRRLLCMLSAGVTLSACAVRQPLPTLPQASVGGGPAGPTRSEQECQAAVDSVVAHQLVAPPATMRTIAMLARPPRGQTALVTFHVDRHGVLMADSTAISGVTDPVYLAGLRATVAQTTFWPAVVNGCAVPSTAELRVESTP